MPFPLPRSYYIGVARAREIRSALTRVARAGGAVAKSSHGMTAEQMPCLVLVVVVVAVRGGEVDKGPRKFCRPGGGLEIAPGILSLERYC